MSLITSSNKKLIAKTDIRCYKVLKRENTSGSFSTFPRNYTVSNEVLMRIKSLKPRESACILEKIKIDGTKYYKITSGAIHVCTSAAILRNNIMDLVIRHIDKEQEESFDFADLNIWEVIIPRGSWYFEDISGESIAAEQIKLVRVVT